MPQINIDTISSAAHLALTEEEKQNIATDVEAILSLGRALVEDGEGAVFHSDTPNAVLAEASLRADEPQEGISREALLSLAPSARDGHVTVPRVISDGQKKEDRT